jgi:hypothetical protein
VRPAFYPRDYFNDTGEPVHEIDFFGTTDTGVNLSRVESLRAAAYWVAGEKCSYQRTQ